MRKGAQLHNHPPSQRLRRGRTPSTRRAGRGSTWSWCRSSEELSKESTPARSVPRSERCNDSSRRVPATTRGNAPIGIPRKTHSLFANTPFSSASRSGARCLSTYMGTEERAPTPCRRRAGALPSENSWDISSRRTAASPPVRESLRCRPLRSTRPITRTANTTDEEQRGLSIFAKCTGPVLREAISSRKGADLVRKNGLHSPDRPNGRIGAKKCSLKSTHRPNRPNDGHLPSVCSTTLFAKDAPFDGIKSDRDSSITPPMEANEPPHARCFFLPVRTIAHISVV